MKFKCVMSKSKRWDAGKVYDSVPAASEGSFNVLDNDGIEWNIIRGDDGFYRYIPRVQYSAVFAVMTDGAQ